MAAANKPDPAQQKILSAYDKGKLSIIAVPGAGKSTMLINLACRLIQDGCPPERILMVTFTEKAAAELAQRLEDTVFDRRIVGHNDGRPTVITLHSLGAKIITDSVNPLDLGLPFQPVLWDDAVQISHLAAICHARRGKLISIELPDENPTADPVAWQRLAGQLSGAIGHCRELGLDPRSVRKLADECDDHRDRRLLQELAHVFNLYEKLERERGAIDYSDQMLFALQLLRDVPEISHRWQDSFDYVIEDESQDSSLAQFELINKMATRCGNLIRVGDPLQSIVRHVGA